MLCIITYLFYNSNGIFILSIPLLIPYIKSWELEQEIQLKRKFIKQLKEYLQNLASAMGTGYAVENAMREARLDMEKQYDKQSRFMQDLYKMDRLLSMNIAVTQIWEQWSKVVDLEELHEFTTVFIVAKQSGGDSVRIIRKSIANICEKLEVEEEIQVGIAGKRLEFQVMALIPIAIILYMRISFPEFMDVLYGNLFGGVIMTMCLVVYTCAYMWGAKMVKIEV